MRAKSGPVLRISPTQSANLDITRNSSGKRSAIEVELGQRHYILEHCLDLCSPRPWLNDEQGLLG